MKNRSKASGARLLATRCSASMKMSFRMVIASCEFDMLDFLHTYGMAKHLLSNLNWHIFQPYRKLELAVVWPLVKMGELFPCEIFLLALANKFNSSKWMWQFDQVLFCVSQNYLSEYLRGLHTSGLFA